MDWKTISEMVGKEAPLLGSLLAGPAGGAIGAMIASSLRTGGDPDAVAAAVAANPEAGIKLRQIEATNVKELRSLAVDQAKAELDAATKAAGDVNKTMQAEGAAEHWPTYSWRPAIGFAVALNIVLATLLVAAVFIAQVAGASGAAAAISALPATLGALAAIAGLALPILGIASFFRGKAQADPLIQTNNKG